jgi:riboflavin kinase/FMN adenylyltransferase
MGLDAALLLRFDRELSQLSAEEFVRRILVDGLHLRAILVGANFRFGHRQSGDVRLLTSLSTPLGYQVEVVAPVSQRSEIVSSTAVRQAVSSGQTLRAARHLGRPFTLAGEIFPATGTGRRLVVPTLNLKTEQELLPANGVYATETWLPAGAEDPLSILQSSGSMDPGVRRYRSVTNIGMRPTFDATRLSVESHLFDFSGDLSSGRMVIAFWGRLREERKFRSPEELLAQIRRDISRATIFFRRLDRFRRPPPSTTEHSAGLEA